VKVIGAMFAYCLLLSGETVEQTDSNCLLSMLAFETASEWVWHSGLNVAIPMVSLFLCLTKL